MTEPINSILNNQVPFDGQLLHKHSIQLQHVPQTTSSQLSCRSLLTPSPLTYNLASQSTTPIIVSTSTAQATTPIFAGAAALPVPFSDTLAAMVNFSQLGSNVTPLPQIGQQSTSCFQFPRSLPQVPTPLSQEQHVHPFPSLNLNEQHDNRILEHDLLPPSRHQMPSNFSVDALCQNTVQVGIEPQAQPQLPLIHQSQISSHVPSLNLEHSTSIDTTQHISNPPSLDNCVPSTSKDKCNPEDTPDWVMKQAESLVSKMFAEACPKQQRGKSLSILMKELDQAQAANKLSPEEIEKRQMEKIRNFAALTIKHAEQEERHKLEAFATELYNLNNRTVAESDRDRKRQLKEKWAMAARRRYQKMSSEQKKDLIHKQRERRQQQAMAESCRLTQIAGIKEQLKQSVDGEQFSPSSVDEMNLTDFQEFNQLSFFLMQKNYLNSPEYSAEFFAAENSQFEPF